MLTAKANLANKVFDVQPLYKILMNQDPAKDLELVAALESVLKKWVGLHVGPFVAGDFSHADLMAFPFIDRFQHTLLYYRGYDMMTGPEPWRAVLAAWGMHCAARPSVAATKCDAAFYVDIYTTYAGERGASTLGSWPTTNHPGLYLALDKLVACG